MKIVITGALGHIGSYLVRFLPTIFEDMEIIMIDDMSTQRYPSLFDLPKNAKYQFVEGDILELDLEPVFKKADCIIHLAAITNAAGSFEIREKVETVNFTATQKVADCCSDLNIPLIHLSSTSVYGTQKEVVDENCTKEELKPQSPYAETKLREERYLREKGSKGSLQYVVCRFGTICGISTGMRFHTAVNKFCWQAVLGQPISVWRTALHQKRPYLTLKDAGEALAFIIKNKLFDNQIYNVLTENKTVSDIVELIKERIGDLQVEYVDAQIMNQLSYEVLNKKLIEKGFNYSGSVKGDIEQTLKRLNNDLKFEHN